MPRIIGHLDLDAFFASVEERDKPYLAGMPIVVGADPDGGFGRGVVSTANYSARRYGIKSAQPIREAWRRSETAKKEGKPAVIFITPSFRKYDETSARVLAIIREAVSVVEVASIDEFYFDLSESGAFPAAEKIALALKQKIKDREKVPASIGIGPNKLIAKIASDYHKPDGLTVVAPDAIEKFLGPLPIRAIPGVGPKGEEKLLRLSVKTVSEARALSREKLRAVFGKWGTDLFEKSRGVDDSPIMLVSPAPQSVGEQETLLADSEELSALLPVLLNMAERIWRKVRREGFVGFRTIVVTVRFADFETVSCSKTFKLAIRKADIFFREALKLLMPFLDSRKNSNHKKIRMIGVRAEKLLPR